MHSLNRYDSFKVFIWSGIERFSVQGLQLILTIILARLLSPSDYGIIAMLSIFIALSNAIIDSGFSNALIQKKDVSESDYSTVFFINIILGILVSACLFLCAPYIADFYNSPILNEVTRWTSLNLIITSFCLVQRTKMTKELNFKSQAKISLVSTLISGSLGVFCAYIGMGVWSLVIQTLVSNFILTALFWILSNWKPRLEFSFKSFRELFSFGSKLMLTGLYGPFFENMYSIFLGKFYKSSILGYYNRAYTIVQFPSSNLTGILNRVSFPMLSSIQDKSDELSKKYRIMIRLTVFFVFPMISLLFVTAEPFVMKVLGPQWEQSIVIIKLLCLSSLLYPVIAYNINILLVKGKSSLHLKLDLIKKIFCLLVLLATIKLGLTIICLGMIVSSLFSYILTAYFSGKLINYSLLTQLRDMFPSFICSVLITICGEILNILIPNYWFALFINIFILSVLYFTLSILFNKNDASYIITLFKKSSK